MIMVFSRVFLLSIMVVMMVVASLSSCTPSVPSRYIQPDEMEEILYDYHIAQSMAQNESDYNIAEYNKTLYYRSVLKKHDVTEAEFDSSMVYYYTYTDRLNGIYSNIAKRLEEEAMGLGASVGDINKYSQYKADGDTANVWNETTAMVLTPKPPYNKYTFSIATDSTYRTGDTFLFQFNSDFLYQNGTKDATAYIAITYENDSVISQYRSIRRAGLTQIRFICDDHKKVKDIRGFIYLSQSTGKDDNNLRLMFITQVQFIRFHKVPTKDLAGNGEEEEDTGEENDSKSAAVKIIEPTKPGEPKKLRLEKVKLTK